MTDSISIDNLRKSAQTAAKNVDSDNSGTINSSKELAAFFAKCAKDNIDTGIIKTTSKQDDNNTEKKDPKLVQPTQHKCNKGFYPATADKNPLITGDIGILANHGKVIKEAQDPAGIVTMAVLATKGQNKAAKSTLGKDQLRQIIIKANPSVFNPDGSLKQNVDLGKLDLPTLDKMGSTVNNETPKRNNVPKGFYPAFADKTSTINGLNERTLRENKDANAVYQVMDALLQTKGSTFFKADKKAMLLNDLVKKNPSVFNPDGSLKPNADLSKLDVPTLQYINQNYKTQKSNVGAIYKFSTSGYYSVKLNGVTKYYQANGQEVTNKNLLANVAKDLL